ncbi:MAG: hypothetical protein KC636_37745, partial [Myxococcales bacterium]|nr:hypothetical protein [Myxococcales bacterium]
YSWSGVMGTTPAWVWDPMTEETCQVADARASALVSDFVLDHARVTARMRVGTADDDDFVGLVFGAQDDAHFYLASWKQTAQAFCDQTVVPAGITIKRIAADAPEDITCADLHNPHDTPRSTLLVAASEVHDVGWKSGVEYLWEIVHLGELMTLRVRAAASQAVIAETTFVDGAYPRGAVGVFASSQAEACFTDVRTTCVD